MNLEFQSLVYYEFDNSLPGPNITLDQHFANWFFAEKITSFHFSDQKIASPFLTSPNARAIYTHYSIVICNSCIFDCI